MAKPKITSKDANRYAMNYGYFYGLEKAKRDFEVTPDQERRMREMLFKHVLKKILEAKKEIARLQTSVARLEAACRSGIAGGENRLMLEMQSFDGWVMSLFESNISLLETIHNPETAGIRVNGLRSSFADLRNRRIAKLAPYDNHPDAFDSTMGIFLP